MSINYLVVQFSYKFRLKYGMELIERCFMKPVVENNCNSEV